MGTASWPLTFYGLSHFLSGGEGGVRCFHVSRVCGSAGLIPLSGGEQGPRQVQYKQVLHVQGEEEFSLQTWERGWKKFNYV